MSVVIWHNPGCSTSRKALDLLREHGVEPTVRNYLKDPPSEKEIRAVLRALGAKDPHALVRKKDKAYAELDVGSMSGDDVIAAMAERSSLIERPVVIAGEKARIGRPIELVLEIL
ncbi:MAG: arsenate reductase (glutaredoxin) [Sandaracinaceae bacterium]